ncbi:MAG: hypothetical protein LM590_04785, partial [Thermofilum sp.]|nr:hypothetical protein [Thermofilum sp.]
KLAEWLPFGDEGRAISPLAVRAARGGVLVARWGKGLPGVLHVKLRLLEEEAGRALRGAAARCKQNHQSVGGRPWCSARSSASSRGSTVSPDPSGSAALFCPEAPAGSPIFERVLGS